MMNRCGYVMGFGIFLWIAFVPEDDSLGGGLGSA